jgi:hypothetical protein
MFIVQTTGTQTAVACKVKLALAGNGSTVVEHLTTNPVIEGSNPGITLHHETRKEEKNSLKSQNL